MTFLAALLQILTGFIVVIILYVITLVIMKIDSLVSGMAMTGKPLESSLIIDGYTNVGTLAKREFNTVNPFAVNFVKIPRSVNTFGGAQFTYQFWIKINEADDALFKNLPLFIKGDNKNYKINLYPYNNPAATTVVKKYPADTYIRCPQIKFGNSWRHLVVQFNTTNTPLTEIDILMNPEASGANRRNLLSLLPINWYMMTFVFEDNYNPNDSSENGIKFTFYLNDVPYQINNATTEIMLRNNYLKQNDGNLTLFPNPTSINSEFMNFGNLTYYNYAVTSDDVRVSFLKGPPSKLAQLSRYNDRAPAHITAFNKIDIYNY